MSKSNYLTLVFFNLVFVAKAIMYLIQYTNYQGVEVVIANTDLGSVSRIYTFRILNNIVGNFLLLIFYSYILRMLNFWDEVYFEKIREIYDSDAFQGEELQEIEYTFCKCYNQLVTNMKRNKIFTKFYVSVFFIYFLVRILSVFDTIFFGA